MSDDLSQGLQGLWLNVGSNFFGSGCWIGEMSGLSSAVQLGVNLSLSVSSLYGSRPAQFIWRAWRFTVARTGVSLFAVQFLALKRS